MKTRRLKIPVSDTEKVSGCLHLPDKKKGTGIIIAHGAGNDMETPLLVFMAKGLAEAGFPVLRFNFLYKEKGRKAPDSPKVLTKTWLAVFRFFKSHPDVAPKRIVAAGKSMGGRIASQMVGDEELPADRLMFLGYPLHPPGKKEKLRDAHLYGIDVPMLFFAGTRDTLCDVPSLKKVLKKIKKSACELEIIEGGDHSFNVLKSSPLNKEQAYQHILQQAVSWLKKKV